MAGERLPEANDLCLGLFLEHYFSGLPLNRERIHR